MSRNFCIANDSCSITCRSDLASLAKAESTAWHHHLKGAPALGDGSSHFLRRENACMNMAVNLVGMQEPLFVLCETLCCVSCHWLASQKMRRWTWSFFGDCVDVVVLCLLGDQSEWFETFLKCSRWANFFRHQTPFDKSSGGVQCVPCSSHRQRKVNFNFFRRKKRNISWQSLVLLFSFVCWLLHLRWVAALRFSLSTSHGELHSCYFFSLEFWIFQLHGFRLRFELWLQS